MADQNQPAERLNFVPVPGIAHFPHLFEPDSKNGKYTLTVLFDKKDPAVSQMMRAQQAKCAEAIRRGIDVEPGRDGKSYAPFSGHSMDDKEWVGRLRLPVIRRAVLRCRLAVVGGRSLTILRCRLRHLRIVLVGVRH